MLYIFINPPITPLMIERYLVRGYPLHKKEYISLKKIPKRVVKYTLALEDPNYYHHFGFEWEMVKQAYKRNQKAGKIRFGASTISNQVARTMFLTTKRNYLRKYLEVQVTLIMEIILTKNRMLELYLNYVEWGKGIYGIETASQYYYHRSISNLGSGKTKQMISVLTNPVKYSPQSYYKSASARQRYQVLDRYY